MPNVEKQISVLLVDDEPLIGLDLCDILIAAGYQVVGPASSASAAFLLLEEYFPKLAIIDVKLRNEICLDLPRQLWDRKIPFIVHTGYPRDSFDIDEFRDAPRLQKPASPSDLLKALSTLSALSVQDGQLPATSDKTASAQALMSGSMP